MNIMDVVKDVGGLTQAKELLAPFLKKLEKLFPRDLSAMSSQEITAALTGLNTEITSINTRLIQLRTQIEAKEKDIQANFAVLKEKFGVETLEDLQKQQANAKLEFDKALQELMQTRKTIEESEALLKQAGVKV